MKKLNLEKIKELRKEHNMSQADMAKVIGSKSVYPYHRKELGNQPFSAEELHAIASYFDKPLEYFFEIELAINAI